MSPTTISAERFTDVVTHHGEGVGWDPVAGVLRCVDMLAGDVVTLAPGGRVARRWHVGPVAAAWRARDRGGVVVGTRRGFALLDAEGRIEWTRDAWDDPAVRMNDGACDPAGRFWCGSMAYDTAPGAGTLWRLDSDHSMHPVLDQITISNGLVWSLDGRTAYHVDTPTGRIDGYRFDPASGTLTDRRVVAEVAGNPDGMTIDSEGGLWVALWGGHAVHRYAVDGVRTHVVEVGPAQVTSCAFGGPGLELLYVTTSREGLPDDADPTAGSVFVADPGIVGVPLATYAG